MRSTVFVASMLLCASAAPADPNGVEQGRAVFRSNCGFCHGLTGKGGRGPSLIGIQKSDDEIKKIVREGVPGSTMPAFSDFEASELDNLVHFVRQLSSGGASVQASSGDPAKGRTIYDRNGCAGCHQIAGKGSSFGPDLTRVGGARSFEYLRESVVNPSADVPESYRGVTVITRDGKRISGIRVNEDTFTVQLRLPNEQFRSYIKDEQREVREDAKSLMPAYKNMPAADLSDLLAYLLSLRGDTAKNATTKKAEGIR